MLGAVVLIFAEGDSLAPMMQDPRLLLITGCAMMCAYAALHWTIQLAYNNMLWIFGCYLCLLSLLV